MTIKVLPDDVILKIAAGEVIERPFSVVKEIVENSIDAGADDILVELNELNIRVLDNGKGMSEEDLKLCYLRHSTSKLRDAEDLFNIHSLGFRGEALASISAVSLMEVSSKQEGEEANKLIVEGGIEKSFQPTAFPFEHGTEIKVNNLFFNTPVRKNFMKQPQTERRLIIELISQYIFAHEEITFKLIIDGKTILISPKANLEEKFYHVYGKEAKSMLSVQQSSEGVKVEGLISKPELRRKSRSDQIFFVNGRLVKNRMFYVASSNAYKGYINTSEYPVIVLKLEIDPKTIDVNIHPTKQEIKFQDDQKIYHVLYHGIKKALLDTDLTTKVELQDSKLFNIAFPEKTEVKVTAKSTTIEAGEQTILHGETNAKQSEVTFEVEDFKIIGIFDKEFILVEKEGKLIVIDFHAAAEIVNYEKFSKQFEEGAISTQSLVENEMFEVSPAQFQLITSNLQDFKKFGFFIEEFGENSLLLRSVPVIMGRTIGKEVLFQIAEDLKEEKSDTLEKIKDKIVMRMACRASEKAGDELTLVQAKKILQDLFKLQGNKYNCPHGRPTLVELSKTDLEKMFKRII